MTLHVCKKTYNEKRKHTRGSRRRICVSSLFVSGGGRRRHRRAKVMVVVVVLVTGVGRRRVLRGEDGSKSKECENKPLFVCG
jgi:hypothetical protein